MFTWATLCLVVWNNFTENVIKELNLFDKTIENIKNTQTLCFIVIVMISLLFLISYLACQQNL